MIKYICRYTPCELFQGFGEECQQLNPVTTQLDLADQLIHPNVCSFCRTLLQEQLQSEDTLILTDCCDSVRRSYDVLRNQGKDVYLLGLPHKQEMCIRDRYWPTPMALGSILTSSASGSCSRRAMDTALRSETSSSGNSSAASLDAE